MMVCLTYIAGPYRAADAWLCEQNIRAAEALAYEVARAGAMPVCPHTNTRQHFEHLQPGEFWLAGTMALLAVCNAAVFTHDWRRSSGAREERAFCERAGTPHFTALEMGALPDDFGAWLEERNRRQAEMLARAAGALR